MHKKRPHIIVIIADDLVSTKTRFIPVYHKHVKKSIQKLVFISTKYERIGCIKLDL
jgi:hypothetical protein